MTQLRGEHHEQDHGFAVLRTNCCSKRVGGIFCLPATEHVKPVKARAMILFMMLSSQLGHSNKLPVQRPAETSLGPTLPSKSSVPEYANVTSRVPKNGKSSHWGKA